VQPLTITAEPLRGGVHVRLAGELELASAAGLEAELQGVEAGGPSWVGLDLRGLSFIDSTGLRLVLAADARARQGGRRLVLVRGGPAVQRVFELTGVDDRLAWVTDPAELG
jgi:anti-sigma B factor antagonist